MFHVELREGPRRLARLNLEEQELMSTLLEPWVRGAPVQLGERTWSPQHTQLTVIEGPEIPIGGMTMGRGWPTALREGREVTEAAIERARQHSAPGATHPHGPSSTGSPSGQRPQAGSVLTPQSLQRSDASQPRQLELFGEALGLELLRRLLNTPISLRAAWRAAHERHPEISAGAALQIASSAISSLSRSGLVTVAQGAPSRDPLGEDELSAALSDPDICAASEEDKRCLWVTKL